MPPSVLALIEEARGGRGVALAWFEGKGAGWGQVGDSFGFLRGHPVRLSDEQIGWLVGIGTFGDELIVIPDVMERERSSAAVAEIVLVAIAAGLRAGVPTQKRQWKGIERIAALSKTLAPLREVLPIGLLSEQALHRGVALGLAQKLGASARPAIEAARATADKKGIKRLDEALAALGGGNEKSADDLLVRLLAEYAKTFDPALVPLIAEIGAAESLRRPALSAKSKGELEAAWLALANKRDPGDVDRLLGTPWPGAWKLALARVNALRSLLPDPRIPGALEKIETQYDSYGSHPLHGAVGSIVRAQTRTKLADAAGPLVLEARGRSRRSVDIEAVWRAFAEDPSDEQRMVLADALQTNGDPRGEYIALSMAIADGNRDPAIKQRAARLLEANIDAWTGPLPGAKRSSRHFDRGFLTCVRLETKGPKLLQSIAAREWCTVEELHLAPADILQRHGEALEELFSRAPMLRAFIAHSYGSEEVFSSFTGPHPRIRAIGAPDLMPEAPIAALPNLALVGTRASSFGPELAFPMADRAGLEVVLLFGVTDFALALERFATAKLPEARLTAIPDFASRHEGWCVRVRRGSDRVDLVWGGGRYGDGSLTPMLKLLAEHARESGPCGPRPSSGAFSGIATAAARVTCWTGPNSATRGAIW